MWAVVIWDPLQGLMLNKKLDPSMIPEIIPSIWIQQCIGSDVAPQVFSATQIFSGELLFSTYLF
jgi:hypothetical protein